MPDSWLGTGLAHGGCSSMNPCRGHTHVAWRETERERVLGVNAMPAGPEHAMCGNRHWNRSSDNASRRLQALPSAKLHVRTDVKDARFWCNTQTLVTSGRPVARYIESPAGLIPTEMHRLALRCHDGHSTNRRSDAAEFDDSKMDLGRTLRAAEVCIPAGRSGVIRPRVSAAWPWQAAAGRHQF